MKKEDIMWEFVLIGIGIAAGVLALDLIFVAPFIVNGMVLAFIILGLCIGSMVFLAEIKNYFVKKMDEEKKDEPPMTEEEQIAKYGGRVVLQFEKIKGYGAVQAVFIVASFIIIMLINLIPYNVANSGVAIESLPIHGFLYQLGDSPIFACQMILVFGVPGLYILALLLGTIGLSS